MKGGAVVCASLKVQAEMNLQPFRLQWLCPCGDIGPVDGEFVEPVA